MAEQYRSPIDEILIRTRRMETRLTGLAIALNVDVTAGKQRVQPLCTSPGMVDVSGLDVSFGDVLAFCRRSGINGLVTVMCGDQLIGSVKTPEAT